MIFPVLPRVAVDYEELAWVTTSVAQGHGLRAALLSPLDQLQEALTDEQRVALKQVRAAFAVPGPFSYIPVSAFLWQWAAYAVLVEPQRRVKETLNDLIAGASDSYAQSPLFKALLLSSEGKWINFIGFFGKWGSLFLNHGVITPGVIEGRSAELVFSGHDLNAARFYVPGLLLGWMRHFGEVGAVTLELIGEQRFMATLRW